MPTRKKGEAKFLNLTAECGYCEKEVILKAEELGFSGYSSDCELCGSHGDVTISFNCPNCDKYQSVEVCCW